MQENPPSPYIVQTRAPFYFHWCVVYPWQFSILSYKKKKPCYTFITFYLCSHSMCVRVNANVANVYIEQIYTDSKFHQHLCIFSLCPTSENECLCVHLSFPIECLRNLATCRQLSDDLSLIFCPSSLFVPKMIPQVVIMTAALTWARPVEPWL